MKHLHFGSVRGDLQEGHVYAKRLRDYASRCHLSLCSSTKMPILCSGGANIWEKLTEACGFCALFADRTKMDIFVLTELIVWSNVFYGICEDYKR